MGLFDRVSLFENWAAWVNVVNRLQVPQEREIYPSVKQPSRLRVSVGI